MLKYKGIEVDVTPNGKFTATVNDADLAADTFEALKTKIDHEAARKKKRLALSVVGILRAHYSSDADDRDGTLGAGIFRGINRHTRSAMIDGIPKNYELDHILADTPANRSLLAQKIAANRLDEKIDSLTLYGEGSGVYLGRHGRHADDYDETMTEIEKKHAEQLAGLCLPCKGMTA